MRWLLKAAGFPLALAPSVALPLLLVAAAELPSGQPSAEHDYRALPELPATAPADTVAELETAAVQLAARLRAVPLGETGEAICPADRLTVSWREPGAAYRWGAHLDPVGPAPGATTDAVNGVVVCQGSQYAFMGFEAWRSGEDWELAAVPYVREEAETPDQEHVVPDPAPVEPVPAPPAPPAPAPLSLDLPAGPIEGYARYEPQRLCEPTPKPGTLALRNLLLGHNPGTRNLGISRACGVGGQSEHKEGRALDWGVLAGRPTEAAAAERFVGALMATDDQGNRHAMARRMGVMYVIWNRRIWSSYRPEAGWRAYGGPSPHTDHVHISLSWAGAQGRTSFWSGKVDPSTLLAYQPPMPSGGRAAPATAVNSGRGRHAASPAGLPDPLPTQAVREAVEEARAEGRGRRTWRDEAAARRERWEELTEAEREEVRRRRQERRGDQPAEAHEGDEAAEAAEAESARRAEERQRREAERQAEQQRQAEEQQRRRAEHQAQKEAERQAKAEEQQRRRAEHQAQKEAERQAKAEERRRRQVDRPAEERRRREVDRPAEPRQRRHERGNPRKLEDQGHIRP